jgi:hypothetical protein
MDMDAIAPMAGLVSIEIPALIVLGGVESFIEDGETASELPQPPVTRAASLSEETPMICRRGLRMRLVILESRSKWKRGVTFLSRQRLYGQVPIRDKGAEACTALALCLLTELVACRCPLGALAEEIPSDKISMPRQCHVALPPCAPDGPPSCRRISLRSDGAGGCGQ